MIDIKKLKIALKTNKKQIQNELRDILKFKLKALEWQLIEHAAEYICLESCDESNLDINTQEVLADDSLKKKIKIICDDILDEYDL